MGTGLFPLADELELLPGTLTPWLQQSLVRLGAWMPFAHAARELGWLSRALGGVLVSESVAARLTEAAGAAYVAEQTAAVERLEQHPRPEPAGPGLLQLSADGAMLSLVGKQWVEIKTLALGRVIQAADGTVRTTGLAYFSRRAEHTAFRRLALVETYRRGVGTALTVVAVMDGADWLQRCIDFHRPDAIRILDFPHAVEYLTRASHEAHGPGTTTTSAWIATQAHALKQAHVDPLLALRTVVCADRWDEAWPQISARLRSDARARSRQLRAERRAARQAAHAARHPAASAPETVASAPTLTSPSPPVPKTIVDGRPTTAHPWKRRFLPHRLAPPAEN